MSGMAFSNTLSIAMFKVVRATFGFGGNFPWASPCIHSFTNKATLFVRTHSAFSINHVTIRVDARVRASRVDVLSVPSTMLVDEFLANKVPAKKESCLLGSKTSNTVRVRG